MHKEIGRVVNDLADARGTELSSDEIRDAFQREYLDRSSPVGLEHFKTTERDSTVRCEARVVVNGQALTLTGSGNGPIDAFVRALGATELPEFDVVSYSEHSLGAGAEAQGRQLHPDQDRPRGRLLRRRASTPTSSSPRSRPSSAPSTGRSGQAMRFAPAKASADRARPWSRSPRPLASAAKSPSAPARSWTGTTRSGPAPGRR